MKRFAIVDRGRRGAEPCAVLSYDEGTREFSVELSERVGADDVPMLFAPFAQRGEHVIGPEWSRRWVESRIVPPSRQNLGQVLRAHGLEEYDELVLLEASRGRSSQDDFEVVPLGGVDRGAREEDAEALSRGGCRPSSSRDCGVSDGEALSNVGAAPGAQPIVMQLACDRGGLAARVGLQLAEARRAMGLTQQELAARAGVRQAVISRLECGKTNPTLGLLEDVARALGRRVEVTFSER